MSLQKSDWREVTRKLHQQARDNISLSLLEVFGLVETIQTILHLDSGLREYDANALNEFNLLLLDKLEKIDPFLSRFLRTDWYKGFDNPTGDWAVVERDLDPLDEGD